MRQVDHHPLGIAARHHLAPERGQAAIARCHRSVAQLIGGIIGQLEDAHAQIGEDVDPAGILAHHRAILEAVDQPGLALRLGAAYVGGGQDLHQVAAVGAHLRIGLGDFAHALYERVVRPGDIADGDVDGGEARGMGFGQHAWAELRNKGIGRLVGIAEATQRIDDDHVLDWIGVNARCPRAAYRQHRGRHAHEIAPVQLHLSSPISSFVTGT